MIAAAALVTGLIAFAVVALAVIDHVFLEREHEDELRRKGWLP